MPRGGHVKDIFIQFPPPTAEWISIVEEQEHSKLSREESRSQRPDENERCVRGCVLKVAEHLRFLG